MDLGIQDRVALVTASSRGLGKEVARRLAEEGCRLSVCSREEGPLRQTASWLRHQTGAEVLEEVCDLTDEGQVETLVRKTAEHFGSLDILVANCGGPPPGKFLDHDTERWRRAVELNLMSAVWLCRETVPHMQRGQWGRIVLMTSISVKQPIDGLILSNSVRAATVGLAKTLANELGSGGILVNSVCPGYFLTDRVRELAEKNANDTGGSPGDMLEKWSRQNVLGRVAAPEEFGSLVAFLCSERASYITGTAIAIDGGLSRALL
jgi:3-oxoacyl-[acyl-carrier protein] reductase